MKTIKAKQISYSVKERNRNDVLYIVIHYTGNRRDTAENNGKYFATTNTREAGAHFFIDRKGNIVKSVPLNHSAWAVGGGRYSNYYITGGGTYFGRCTNSNSVSIELCDIVDQDPSPEQIKAVKKCIKYIRKYCVNAKQVIRHFDVTGKACPGSMCISSANTIKWKVFLDEIGENSKIK